MTSRESIEYEIKEIENSVNMGDGAADNRSNRRGSSLFVAGGIAMDETVAPGELLVDFPTRDNTDMVVDDKSDKNISDIAEGGTWKTESSREQNIHSRQDFIPDNNYSGVEEARLQRLKALENSEDLPGGPNHRPLVGGFAAAAYEAARAHHYSMKKSSKNKFLPRDNPPPTI